jgi:hypothetical protein
MWPTAEAITPIASPCASAIAVRLPPPVAMIEPAPTKISVNAPTNSANPRWSASRFTLRTLRGASDGSFEGWSLNPPRPTYLLSTAERKAAMSAEILKRKLRNFPVASLSIRISNA